MPTTITLNGTYVIGDPSSELVDKNDRDDGCPMNFICHQFLVETANGPWRVRKCK
jgi:hypothetical protein